MTNLDLSPGDILPPQRYEIDQALIDRYAKVSGDLNPLHTDPAFAAGTIYGRTIAHGMMTLAMLSQVLEDFAGPDWREGGDMDVRFLAPVFPGDVLEISGVCSAVAATRRSIWKVRCSVSDKDVLVGTVSWHTDSGDTQ